MMDEILLLEEDLVRRKIGSVSNGVYDFYDRQGAASWRECY